jgi:hypothetical protein
MKEKSAAQVALLSRYGDDDQRQHSPIISTASIMLVYKMPFSSLGLLILVTDFSGWVSYLLTRQRGIWWDRLHYPGLLGARLK